MARIMLNLSDEELNALYGLAKKERRDTRAQAEILILRGLEECKFIQPSNVHNKRIIRAKYNKEPQATA
jgi:hypothetical protein